MERRYRLSEKTKRFFLITLLLTPACYQIMPEIRMALVLAAMGEAVLSADRIWARNERFPFANLYDDRNPLYVRKMMKKRKWLSGINGYFVVQILLLSQIGFEKFPHIVLKYSLLQGQYHYKQFHLLWQIMHKTPLSYIFVIPIHNICDRMNH